MRQSRNSETEASAIRNRVIPSIAVAGRSVADRAVHQFFWLMIKGFFRSESTLVLSIVCTNVFVAACHSPSYLST
jgi:hypothetical protein